MTPTGRIEVVQSDAAQPWHFRVLDAQGRVLATSENYARKVGAERGILALAGSFQVPRPELDVNADGSKFVVSEDGFTASVPIRYLDERAEP